MQNRGDSSIWRSLAVAFGDGLAFGAGVKLTQNAARHAGAPKLTEGTSMHALPPSTGADQKVLDAIVNALEARLKEHSGQVERSMADLAARMALELKALDDQDHTIAHKVTDDLNALEGQVISLNRQFGQAVARIVAEQVAAQVEARTAVMESHFAAAEIAMGQRLAAMVSERLAPMEQQLRTEIGEKDREIAELRQRLADADTTLLDIVSGIGQVCRQAAERMGRPAPAPVPIAAPVPAAETPAPAVEGAAPDPAADSAGEPPLPGFAQPQKPGRLWRVPLVSSLVILVTGGLFLAHYL